MQKSNIKENLITRPMDKLPEWMVNGAPDLTPMASFRSGDDWKAFKLANPGIEKLMNLRELAFFLLLQTREAHYFYPGSKASGMYTNFFLNFSKSKTISFQLLSGPNFLDTIYFRSDFIQAVDYTWRFYNSVQFADVEINFKEKQCD